MKLCPVAYVTGCKNCPFFSICPLKRFIGDQYGATKKDSNIENGPKKM